MKLRLVFLIKDETYGFRLRSSNKGHRIRNVVEGGIADLTGIKSGDRIIQVNGTSVKGSSHSEVVNMIRGSGEGVTLLLVDKQTDAHFKV